MQLNNQCWNKGISGEKTSYLNYIYTCTGVKKHEISFSTSLWKCEGGLWAAPVLPSRLATSKQQ